MITQKVLNALFEVLSSKTSNTSAQKILSENVFLLQGIHNILNNVKIDTSKSENQYVFDVLTDINSVESYKLGKAFRDLITIIQKNHKDIPLIADFKEKLGDDYLSQIEKLGVNLHFLELKYK